MTNIDSNNFIATPAAFEKLAGEVIDNEQRATSARGTILKVLVATTQAELGSPPRQRNVRAESLSAEAKAAQLAAFQIVSDRFYAIVQKVASATVPDPDKALLRSRTGFFRSASSTVRGFIRAGNDIRSLAAHKVTKAGLATPHRARKFTVDALRRRSERLGRELEKVARNLNAANSEIARAVLGPILAQLAVASGAIEHEVKDSTKAMEEGKPFHTRTDVFVPISLAAVREARKAA